MFLDLHPIPTVHLAEGDWRAHRNSYAANPGKEAATLAMTG